MEPWQKFLSGTSLKDDGQARGSGDESSSSSGDDDVQLLARQSLTAVPRARPHPLKSQQPTPRPRTAHRGHSINIQSSTDDDETQGPHRLSNRSEKRDDAGESEEEIQTRYPTRRPAARGPIDGFVNSTTIEISDDEVNSSSRPAMKISYESPKLTRTTISRAAKRKSTYTVDDGDDSSDDVDELSTMSPAYAPKPRPHIDGNKRPRLSDLHKELLNEDPNRRTSGRKRNLRFGNLLDYSLDNLEVSSDEESTKTKSPRPVGPKEIFKSLSLSDPFRMRHLQYCRTCSGRESREKGRQLIFCQGCQNAYHHVCLGPRRNRDHLVSRVAEYEYVLQCRFCIGLAHKKNSKQPHLGRCVVTKELGPMSRPLRQPGVATIDTIVEGLEEKLYKKENVMFRCGKCNRAWTMSKLPPIVDKSVVSDESADEGEGDKDLDDDKIADTRYREYVRKQKCNECLQAPEPETLAGWRPTSFDGYDPETRCYDVEEAQKEYLVKWKKLSYYKVTWMPGDWVWGVVPASMRKAFEKRDQDASRTTEAAIPEDYIRADIIFDVRYEGGVRRTKTYEDDMALAQHVTKAYMKYKGLRYEDSVWEAPPAPEEKERWQDFLTAYEDWVRGHYVHLPNAADTKRRIAEARTRNFENELSKKKQPASLTGGTLLDYQLDGMNWLYYMWFEQQNAILADEMGLGKTIQVIALLTLLRDEHRCWPFLVVCPNSTVANWRREAEQWAPTLRVTTYFGSAAARDLARQYQLFPGSSNDLRCHLVITSYEAIIDSHTKRMFQHIPWEGLIVDEGQRLKNDANQIYGALNSIKFPFKLLLTGTPLQNNIRELFNLLQFLDPTKHAEELAEDYSDLDKDKIAELHTMLRPFILRRTKETHLTFLPPMAAIILPVSMTILQKKLYKNILEKNPALIRAIFNKQPGTKLSIAERSNLNNILMQLRKCLCHPFVYSRAIEDTSISDRNILHRNLTEASAKLKLLELLLPKLHERGHRILIFSQFLENLDIIEDFLDGIGLLHCRIDGKYSSLEKQKQIDRFNEKDSPYFAFLLSTRAGGVGINLATADTVIIMDPDFNPHQDMQALARAHRIGQKNKVLVFKLMTQATVEEKIMQIGKKKMLLDHVLIERLDQPKDSEEDLEAILKHGATDIFQDKSENDIYYDNEAIDHLLDRSTIETASAGAEKNPESQFSFARVWKNDSLEDSLDSSERATPAETVDVWDKILQERERAAAEAAKAREELGRGKRNRQRVDYSTGSRAATFGQGSRIPSPEVDEEFMPDLLARDVASSSSDETSDGDFDDLMARKHADRKKSTLSLVSSAAPSAPSTSAPAQPATAPSLPTKLAQTHASTAQLSGTIAGALPRTQNVPATPSASTVPTTQASITPDSALKERIHQAEHSKAQAPPPAAVPRMPRPVVPDVSPDNGSTTKSFRCPVCLQSHLQGQCPLKLAGVEMCNICKEAHFGIGRTCPHFRSEEHVKALLETIKMSSEDKYLKDEANRYLRGVLGDIRRRKKQGNLGGIGRGRRRTTENTLPADTSATMPTLSKENQKPDVEDRPADKAALSSGDEAST